MRWHGLAAAVVSILIFAVLGAMISFAAELVDTLGDLVAAVVAGIFVLLTAVWTQTYAKIREQDLLQQEEKRTNYMGVLSHVGSAIRERNLDELSTAHLQSWIVGSESVVSNTQDFLLADDNKKRKKALLGLLQSMRKDIGLRPVKGTLELQGVFRREETGWE